MKDKWLRRVERVKQPWLLQHGNRGWEVSRRRSIKNFVCNKDIKMGTEFNRKPLEVTMNEGYASKFTMAIWETSNIVLYKLKRAKRGVSWKGREEACSNQGKN